MVTHTEWLAYSGRIHIVSCRDIATRNFVFHSTCAFVASSGFIPEPVVEHMKFALTCMVYKDKQANFILTRN
jgi:hypothetical protein